MIPPPALSLRDHAKSMSLGGGGGGSGKKMTKCDMGGRGVKRKNDVTHHKIQSNQFSFLQFSILKSPQSFLIINPFWSSKFLKSSLTTYSLAHREAFQRSLLYSSSNHKSPISHRYIIHCPRTGSIYYFFLIKSGKRGSREKMTKCDMGGGGSKMALFGVTYFLHGPLAPFHTIKSGRSN